jgi:hypothetical protein
MQCFLDLFISINCSTCFRWFLRPSSGAQNCTYSVRYCQTNTAACLLSWMRRNYVHPWQQQAAVLVWQYLTLFVQFFAPDDGRRNCLKRVQQFTEIEKMLHLVGCTLEIPKNQILWTSDLPLPEYYKKAAVCAHNVYMCWTRFSEWTEITSLNIVELIFIQLARNLITGYGNSHVWTFRQSRNWN